MVTWSRLWGESPPISAAPKPGGLRLHAKEWMP
jgi:hypothetical protein